MKALVCRNCHSLIGYTSIETADTQYPNGCPYCSHHGTGKPVPEEYAKLASELRKKHGSCFEVTDA